MAGIYGHPVSIIQANEANYTEVANYAALPTASEHSGEIYIVLASTGVWPINHKRAGLYYSNGASWSRLGDMPTHKDAHDPEDGGDPLDTDTPVATGTTNTKGTSHSFSRSDHVHETDISADTSPELGGNLVVGEFGLNFDLSPADRKYSGLTIDGGALESMGFGDLVALSGGGWVLVDADVEAKSKNMWGIVVTNDDTIVNGQAIKILLWGFVTDESGYNFTTMGAPLFCTEVAGTMSETSEDETDEFVRVAAYATPNVHTVFINFGAAWLKVT